MTLEEWAEPGGGVGLGPGPISAKRSLLLGYSQPPASHPRSVETTGTETSD